MGDPTDLSVVILAGGRGARFDYETKTVPKPMIEVAGKPILGHIMDLYESQGFHRFIVLGGYLLEVIDGYLNARYGCVSGRSRDHISHYGWNDGRPETYLIDTGADASTGDRLIDMIWDQFPRAPSLGGPDMFLLTYGDGLCDVDIERVVSLHRSQRQLRYSAGDFRPMVTLTAVNPPGRFGVLDFTYPDGPSTQHARVGSFREKGTDEWINGGFMVVDYDSIQAFVPRGPWAQKPHAPFETGALPQMAEEGCLFAYKHTGYWRCMDTRRDLERIERDIEENRGELPWLRKDR